MKRFIKLNQDDIVYAERIGKEIKDGEIESETGQIGQRMLEDGTFVDVPVEPIEPQPSIEERLENIEATIAYNQLQTEYLVILAEFNAL